MKIKSLLLLAACGTMLSASAQSHHGYFMKPTSEMTDAYVANNSTAPATLNCWATPKLIMPIEKADKSVEISNIYKDNAADMIVRPTTMNGSKNYFKELTGTSVTPSVTAANFAKGYLEVTVPNKMDYPRTDANTENWTDMPSSDCVMNFHICLGSKPYRINDVGNKLSATGEECYMKDCTGLYVGIKAPAGCTVKGYMGVSTLSEANFKKDTSGLTWNSNFYGTVAPAVFDFAEPCDGTYKEMTSGAPYNCLAGIKYSSSDWPSGYCVKYLDVAVYGVKPGDVIGFGGMQTLHDGWTPKSFVEGAGVNDIFADDVNAPVEVYNLNGMKVANDNLAPGVYVKRQGNKTTKFIVK